MKRTGTCPKCESKRVMHIARVAHATDYYGSGIGDISSRTGRTPVTRTILVERKETAGLFGKSTEHEVAGEVEAYACADCGYFEEYLRDPAKSHWDAVEGALPYGVKTRGGPFR